MNARPEFSFEIDQNKYLARGGREVNAIVKISASGAELAGAAAAPQAGGPEAAEVIMVDCSGSMDYPSDKMVEARNATAAAIDALRDGVFFAVIAGTSLARMAYPRQEERLVAADTRTRAEAKNAVSRLMANGGTAMGTWLSRADALFATRPNAIRHAILLTDGKNEHETPEQLDRVLAAAKGNFICDARGIGDGWIAKELMKITGALLGEADAVEKPEHLEAAFRTLTAKAMGKSVADAALRVKTTQCAQVRFVKQVYPDELDLTGMGTVAAGRTNDYPLGSWGRESRDYHVCLDVDPTGLDTNSDVMTAKLSLVLRSPGLPEEVLTGPQWRLLAQWTDDARLSTQINVKVAHYTGQQELGQAIRDGLDALERGEKELATARLGQAVKWAAKSGNDRTARLLADVVDVVDAREGTVRLKADTDRAKVNTARLVSVKTVRVTDKDQQGKK